MANPNKVFTKELNKQDFNLLLFFNFFLAFAGSIFLAWNGVLAGTIYTLMFIGVLACIFMITIFLKNDNSLKPITDYVRIPMSGKATLTLAFYMCGLLIPLILNVFLKLFTNFSVISFDIPLFGTNIIGSQSLSAVEFGSSMDWKIFNIVFTAGNIETFTYNFGLVLIGVLIAVFTYNLITKSDSIGFISKKFFILTTSFIISTAFFMISHYLNKTYDTQAFIIAGIFLLVANVSIYMFGVLLAFWAGYHQMNNLIWLVQQEGLQAVMQGFISWFGAIYLIYLGLIVWYLLRNKDEVKRDMFGWLGA